MQGQWTLDPAAQLALRLWDGEAVVHHLCSNHTHRLAEPAGAVLSQLRGHSGSSVQDLARAIDEECEELLPLLHALRDLGLLRQC